MIYKKGHRVKIVGDCCSLLTCGGNWKKGWDGFYEFPLELGNTGVIINIAAKDSDPDEPTNIQEVQGHQNMFQIDFGEKGVWCGCGYCLKPVDEKGKGV